ncbi:hypothetical protein [Hufsiella ginkgonis]|uniref:DUF4097 family beta strand repeat protein n=1 Tax=Hufsiella ginkgonis TaxID=2695274 RepID=A0A7K1Y3D7_9SPHI|nr:hypothetical protein [Hufsiella ginkgonis]MXV17752.1 hypothetical protein [Hufsiella ginkgonis]
MKTNKWILLSAGWSLCFAQVTTCAQDSKQEFKEHISKQFTLQKPAAATVLAIYNMHGTVNVEGYSGSTVSIEIDKTIVADNAEEMAAAKAEYKLEFEQKADSILSYSTSPYETRPRRSRNWDDGRRRIRYRVELEYTVKVPFNMNVCASTVNKGSIGIKDVYGSLQANNVNGPITVVNAKGTSNIRTINGNVTVNYLAIPTEASSYYTINGKLEVTFPSSLAANVQFKSMNGQFYTDFPDTEVLPGKVEKSQTKKNGETMYKLSKRTEIKVGAGGKLFTFETLNGNIYLKKS